MKGAEGDAISPKLWQNSRKGKEEEFILTHIVGGPPGLEFEVPLHSGSQVLLKVFSQALHSFILLIIHQWAH